MKIIALESWNGENNEPKTGMKNLLSFVAENNKGVSLHYSFLYTPREMEYILRMTKPKGKTLLYFSMHGRPNFVDTGTHSEFEISLDDLALYMGETYKGCGVHFASCAILSSDKDTILGFIDKTKVSFVSGYKFYVDFLESSLMDLAFLQRWVWSRYNRPMLEKLFPDYKNLTKTNGFSYYMKP